MHWNPALHRLSLTVETFRRLESSWTTNAGGHVRHSNPLTRSNSCCYQLVAFKTKKQSSTSIWSTRSRSRVSGLTGGADVVPEYKLRVSSRFTDLRPNGETATLEHRPGLHVCFGEGRGAAEVLDNQSSAHQDWAPRTGSIHHAACPATDQAVIHTYAAGAVMGPGRR